MFFIIISSLDKCWDKFRSILFDNIFSVLQIGEFILPIIAFGKKHEKLKRQNIN